jgi:hypothetical protein
MFLDSVQKSEAGWEIREASWKADSLPDPYVQPVTRIEI